jgi:hypothetical protein
MFYHIGLILVISIWEVPLAAEKQIQANRLNGLKGGVKTMEGKAVSRMNALSHGFFCNDVLHYLQYLALETYVEV